jgi:hypothetical protein
MIRSNLGALVLCAIMLAQGTGAAGQEAAHGVSALEAQELTARELASRVLGDVGAALIIDVDRPEWGSDPGAWARRRGATPPSVPSPLYELVFWARPTLSSFGLCQQLLIKVHFARPDRDGARQQPDDVRTEVRFGVVGELTPPEGDAPSAHREAREAQCARQPAGRDYFPADGGASAHQAALITQQLASLGEAGETPTFPFSCRTFNRPCNDESDTLRSLNWRGIRSVEAVPCGPGPHTVRFPRCLTIVYGITFENGRRAHTLGYQTLRVVAGFSARDMEIESAEIRFDSAVP